MATPPDIPILRDPEYHRVWKRDHRRQVLRRWAHRLWAFYEKHWKFPRWKQETQGLLPDIKPTLSVCILTMDSAHRIAPLLDYLRPWVDELVVAVDSKTQDNTLEVCTPLTDVCFVFENDSLTCNAGLEAVVGRCTGDWILRLDDDEYPEPHLFEMLPGLLYHTRCTHFKLPRLHLSSVNTATQTAEWIDDGYLYPDYQLRLFKNQPELLTFPGAVGHLNVSCKGKRGKLHTPNLVHLNMAINPRWKREEKLRKYVKRLNGGWAHPINEAALMFEDFSYTIRPYQYPNPQFIERLVETTAHQSALYNTEESRALQRQD